MNETLIDQLAILNTNLRTRSIQSFPCVVNPLRGSTSIYLDILAKRASGRPVLIECKLWKNPAGQGKLLVQILQYESLQSDYADVDAEATLKVLCDVGDGESQRA